VADFWRIALAAQNLKTKFQTPHSSNIPRVLPCHWLPATFRRRMTARGNNLLAAFFCEALLKDFHIVSSFNYNLEPFHGSS
jgi:hypothetical protein